jgi:hypothetical protein
VLIGDGWKDEERAEAAAKDAALAAKYPNRYSIRGSLAGRV